MPVESTSATQKTKTAPALAWFTVGALGLTVVGAGAVVFFFNPSTHGFYPVCLFHRLTGWNCPSCGGTRALYALLHGDWRLALKDNALFVFLALAAALRGAWWGAGKLRHRPGGQFFPARYVWPLLATAAAFTVLRNLPVFGFLSP